MNEFTPFPAEFLNRAGLNRQHVFDLAALPPAVRVTLGDTAGYRQLLLLGHGGRKLWECVKAGGLAGEHPIDDYCVRTVRRWLEDFMPGRHYRLLYPGESAVGLQQLGTLAGWHHPAPFMVGVDGEWGSWYAYRAALLANTDFRPFAPAARSNPCLTCQGQPCITACPAGAMQDGQFALEKCIAYRKMDGSRCADTCLARVACPVGSEHRYTDEQLQRTYALSLRMIKQHY